MKPLVPTDVDLRGLPYMPLDVNRLRDSQLSISASGDEFRAAVLLWCASWNQVPAGSLPSEDEALSTYAGYGRSIKEWKKVKVGAMRGFVLCDDGRWYHPVIAEKALQAWQGRLDSQDRRENESQRLKNHREEHKALRAELRSFGLTFSWSEKIETLRAAVQVERLKRNRTPPETRTGALQVVDENDNRTPPETRTGPLPATAKKLSEVKLSEVVRAKAPSAGNELSSVSRETGGRA